MNEILNSGKNFDCQLKSLEKKYGTQFNDACEALHSLIGKNDDKTRKPIEYK